MAEQAIESGEKQRAPALLRERLSRFVANGSAWKKPLHAALQRIEREQWPAVVFGGVLRDLMVFGASERPRDVDIVVDHASSEDIIAAFADQNHRRTRFGGVRIQLQGWLIDVWPLRDTWAFREYKLPCGGFHDLPSTTFLNIEAVVAELFTSRGRERAVYSAGFFEALVSRTVEINLETNPFPALCIVRSLIIAARLDFRIGCRLAHYIAMLSNQIPTTDLIKAQEMHYGNVRLTPSELEKWIVSIREQLLSDPHQPVRLPITAPKQLMLRSDWSPAA